MRRFSVHDLMSFLAKNAEAKGKIPDPPADA